MTNNLNEADIDIKEDSTNPEDVNVGPWIHKDQYPHVKGGVEQYGLRSYCKERVFCKTGYKPSSCKQTIESPIKCVPINSGGRRSKRQSKRKRRTRRR